MHVVMNGIPFLLFMGKGRHYFEFSTLSEKWTLREGGGSGRDAKRLRNCTEIKIRWEDALKTLLISGRQLMTCWQNILQASFFEEMGRMDQFTAFGAASITNHSF